MSHPVVFIHGLWLHASSWDRWVRLFADRGRTAVAPGWPGDAPTVAAARETSTAAAERGTGDVSAHFAGIAAGFSASPVLIGHGLGGLLALTLAPQTHAAGVIAIEAVLISARTVMREPPRGPGAAALSRAEFRTVYGAALSSAESDRLYERWAIPAPRWALHDPVAPDAVMPRPEEHAANSSRVPVLLMAGGKSGRGDIAHSISGERRLLAAGSDFVVFPDQGPSLHIDGGWRLVAESCLSWLDAHEL